MQLLVSALMLLGWLTCAIVAAFLLGTVAYVLASYTLMRAHTSRRGSGQALREMVREAGWALLTQPLLLCFYGLGERLARGQGTPVVVVHGYMQNRVDFLAVARRLGQRGLGPVWGFNYPWYRSVRHNSKRLAAFVERVCARTGQPKVILVCHSMGGLVALHYLLFRGGDARVSRCATIASPHAGILYRGPVIGAPSRDLRKGSELVGSLARTLPVPVLSIASTHDNVVYPQQMSSLAERGGTDFVVEGPGHLAILFDRRVLERLSDFVAGTAASASAHQAREMM